MPKEEYDRAKQSYEQSSNELYDVREQLKTLRERFEKQIKDMEELDRERK